MKQREMARKLSETLSLPGQALGEPRLSVWSDRRLTLENHGGILQWSDRELVLRWGRGKLWIAGEELRILAMEEKDLALQGRILCLEWRE